jgi:hypothetical protein
MNAYTYSLLALEIARERSREAEERWVASRLNETPTTGTVRRAAAKSMALVSRASALVAHRLDARVTEDLRRALPAAK